MNLDGDKQSDLKVHGGKSKAVYCYPIAHYDYWKKEFPGRSLPPGSFGENFTIECPLEHFVYIGDRLSIGSAELVVTQPRLPCYKLGIRLGSGNMVNRFLESGRSGFFMAVVTEGDVGAGDEAYLRGRDANAVSISEINRLCIAEEFGVGDARQVRRGLKVEALPDSWKRILPGKIESSWRVTFLIPARGVTPVIF
jgi:MOSC domain-containing protein YiiM